MRHGISRSAVGHASSLFLAISFSLCIAFDLVFPDLAMYKVWKPLLPGFDRLAPMDLLLGLLGSYAYGWYFALIWVPIYNSLVNRDERRES